jgi:hypothetical protein
MKTSLNEYISSLDLTAEEKAQLAPILANKKVTEKIDAELAGAQSEISRRFDEAAKVKDANDKYATELATWKTNAEKNVAALETNFRKANETNVQFKARLEALVRTGALDEDEVKDILAAEPNKADPPKNDPAPRDDDGRFISREAYTKDATNFVRLPAQVNDLAAKHIALFGKPIDNMDSLVVKAIEQKKPLSEIWSQEYKVADRERELATAREKEHDDQVRRDERQKVLSEVSNPTSRQVNAVSPVLGAFPVNKEVRHEGQTSGVAAAVAAYNEGKYRDNAVAGTK